MSARGKVDIFYFRYMGSIAGGVRPLTLERGDRDMFFLMREDGRLRTICNRWRTCCLAKVVTGPHPSFRRQPAKPINQAITDFLFERGIGINDKQMVDAIEQQQYSVKFGEEPMVATLQQLASSETPLVREAACESLRSLKHPCGDEAETRNGPSVQIQI